MQLEIQALPGSLMPTARFAAAAVVALGREEALGRRPKRLLEPGLATWQQFRGRMGALELVELLCEDAAVTQPSGFTRPTEILPLSAVPAAQVDAWLAELPALGLDGDGEDYVTAQAKRLGLSTRMARSGLHKMQSHHKVLELPGSGGQLSYFVARRDGLFLQDVFTIACTDWTELALAGFVSVELGLSGAAAPALVDPQLRAVRDAGTAFDFVIGITPDKGGSFDESKLRGWFPHATVLLV
jgi:hypothetical protein